MRNTSQFEMIGGPISRIQACFPVQPGVARVLHLSQNHFFVFSLLMEDLMISILPGEWMIRSVSVNSQPASKENGFLTLVSESGVLRIEPAGIVLRINQATDRSAVLESRSQVFFADYFTRGNELTLNLSRPQFAETVSITAILNRELAVN